MTPEQRIAQLEAELAHERARADNLQEIVHALTVKKSRSSGAERQARYRERQDAVGVTGDVTVTRNVTAPPPLLDGSPPLSKPISPSPLSSPPRTALSAGADLDGLPDATDDAQPILVEVPKAASPRPEELQGAWNQHAHHSLPRWQGMSDTRRQRASARLRERPVDAWILVIQRLSASPFCRGEEKGSTWRASPDWLLQPDVADKVLEGKYDRAGGFNAPTAPASPVKMRVM